MGKNNWKQKSLAMLLAFTMGLGVFGVPGMSYAEVAVADTYIDKEIIKEQAEPSDITNETDLENQLEPNITTPSVIELEPLMALAVEQKSFALGKGTEEEPYQIANEADLRLLSKLVNKGDVAYTDKCYLLTDNIKLKSVEDWTPIGTESSPFKGCFDGGGKAIEDITAITSNLPPDLNYLGLFGNVLEGSISNLTLEIKIYASNSQPNLFVGGLAGSITGNDKSVISNVAVSGEIGVGENKAQKELRLGGLIGSGSKVKIENSNSEVAIETGRQYSETVDHKIGGFIGLNDQGSIEGSSASGQMKVKVEGSVGGFIGVNKGEIIECSATGAVENSNEGQSYLGGFVGMNASEILGCSAIGEVENSSEGDSWAGGFVGKNTTEINKCSSTGNAIGKNVGGFFCDNDENGEIINCSSQGNVLGSLASSFYVGGFGGQNLGNTLNCYSTGDVETKNPEKFLGEFLGSNDGQTKNCYASGKVIGQLKEIEKGFVYFVSGVSTLTNSYFNLNEVNNVYISEDSGEFGDADVNVKGSKGINKYKMKSSMGEADELVTIMNNNIISENKRGIWLEWGIRPSENNGFPVLVEYTNLGEGTLENPYIISNVADLIVFSKHINSENEKYNDKFYELKNDIDMYGFEFRPIGTKNNPFRGHFNGGNKSISNINMGTLTEPIKGLKYVGLFGYIDGGSITDLKVQATIYSDANYMGLLAGAIEGTDTRISNVELRGGLTSAWVAEDKKNIMIGALAGYVKDATVQNSNGNIHVKNNFYGGQDVNIGGFVGANEGGKINNCKIESIIESTKSPNSGGMKYIGGFVGLNQSFGEISNCSVSPRINGGDRGTIGGFAGGSYGEILNCSVKKIEGFDSYVQNDTVQNTEFCKIGGFIGVNLGKISNCASNIILKAANVSTVGSFASDNNKTIVNCYAAGKIQFNGNVGFVYMNGSDANLKHIYYDKQYTKLPVTHNRGETSESYGIAVSEMKASPGMPNAMLDALNGDFKTDESKAQWKWVIIAGENEGFPVFAECTNLGDGTSENPYIISNALDLVAFSKHINSENEKYNDKFYELKSDIDMSGLEWIPIGTKDKPFRGHFNGGNKSISNIKMGTLTEPIKGLKYVGLFGYIDGGSITDLKVQASIYSDANYMGLLAGAIEGTDTRISNVELRGGLTSAWVAEDKKKIMIGAVAGYVKDATVQKSEGIIVVENSFYGGQEVNIGGFVGENDGGKINNCKIQSVLNSTPSSTKGGIKHIGGFVGLNQNFGKISNCSVSPRINGGDRGTIGGFAGGSYGEILNCSVKKTEGFDSYVQNDTVKNKEFCKIGGFIGANFGKISNCASNIILKAANISTVGSFASDNNKTIVNCYAAGKIQFNENVGFVYMNGSDANLQHIYYDKQYTKLPVTHNIGKSSEFHGISISEMKVLSGGMLDALNGDFKTEESKAQWNKWVITAGENEGFPVLGDSLLETDIKAPVMTAGKTERTSGGNATVKSNDKAQNIGKETIKEENGKKIIELSITPEFVIAHVSKKFKFGDDKNIVEIKVTDTDAETARVVLTGNMVKKLEDNNAVLSIQKDNIKYNIPAKEMTVESVAKKLNVDSSKLKEMQIEIEISKISGELAQKYQEIAKVVNNEVIIPPVEFNIIGRVTSEDGSKQTVNINRFSSFVERTVELPQGNESKGAMTGIVFNSDGTYSPVPTKLVTENGRSYVKMNSLTNSIYSVIYNPITVDSVKLHWSESSVNDMASRLVLVDTKSFEPNKAISRAEFANYIVRALGLYQGDAKPGQSEFTDVKSDNPSLKGITIASQWGIIGGYPDGSFRPQNTITREEAMSMYSRAMDIAQLEKSDDSRILNYKDQAKVSSWAYKAVQKTLGSGVFNGRTAQDIEPKGTFTCSEAAVAIRNLLIKAELING